MTELRLTAEIVDQLSLDYNKARRESGVKEWQCLTERLIEEYVEIERFQPSKTFPSAVYRSSPIRLATEHPIDFLTDRRSQVPEERWSRIEEATYRLSNGVITELTVKAAVKPSVGEWREVDTGVGGSGE
ncbi:hypothetical protein CH305_18355 [Rhodococcus sp. 15-649-2-2]|uniref:hypothetical protein n=1 Tax=Rhodococcus sp. 15-649-2-2 TaxID=2023140 RepID=UPI000B9A54EE|nr:hypothetical protein [Rhodococcus sp. 15-649-2-2]OZE77200.1 hypothetical protein CH305_18355 [Rhodococcus sp. 15-649-2-2]